jgi:hypothetical protein
MKKLLACLFILPYFVAYSQDAMYADSYSSGQKVNLPCDKAFVETFDKMTGGTTYHLEKPLKLNKGGNALRVVISRDAGVTFFNIAVTNTRPCIGEGEQINILFTDGTRLEAQNIAAGNCDGIAVLAFGEEFENTHNLTLFTDKYVEAIRVYTNDHFVQTELSEKNWKDLQQSFQCLAGLSL